MEIGEGIFEAAKVSKGVPRNDSKRSVKNNFIIDALL
jgi:hypothetical protein